jgi:hypothetical protein
MPRVDFWQYSTEHRAVAVAAAQLSKTCRIIRPLIIISYSSKVANILQSDLLATVWKAESDPNTFMSQPLDQISIETISGWLTSTSRDWKENLSIDVSSTLSGKFPLSAIVQAQTTMLCSSLSVIPAIWPTIPRWLRCTLSSISCAKPSPMWPVTKSLKSGRVKWRVPGRVSKT